MVCTLVTYGEVLDGIKDQPEHAVLVVKDIRELFFYKNRITPVSCLPSDLVEYLQNNEKKRLRKVIGLITVDLTHDLKKSRNDDRFRKYFFDILLPMGSSDRWYRTFSSSNPFSETGKWLSLEERANNYASELAESFNPKLEILHYNFPSWIQTKKE